MVDSYILEFNNATLRIVVTGTNDYFDLNVARYKKVWNNFEYELGLNNPYGNLMKNTENDFPPGVCQTNRTTDRSCLGSYCAIMPPGVYISNVL